MPNLNSYINFSTLISKTPTASTWVIHDTGTYPVGVNVNLKGWFQLTQPDGIAITTGSFLSPSIYWTGSQLSIGSFELRLRSTGGYQQGTYRIEYHIIASGYDETVLIKTFELSYTSPTLTIEKDFDVFTPVLTVTDNTTYTQSAMTLNAVVRSWEATIISVEGTNQDIAGSLQTFDLGYLGSYYDSRYDVSLTATATYTLSSPDNWVQISDQQEIEDTYYAFIPPSIIDLLELLTAYKTTIDSYNCVCGPGCVGNCTELKCTYSLAVSIYTHIVERGRAGDTDGLDAYVLQLQKLLSNCVTPTYTNTNAAIIPYDWGSTGGTTLTFYKQMVVGSGVNNAPPDGATSYTDTNLIGKNVIVFLDGLLMGIGLSDRVSITYNSVNGAITWNTPLYSPQLISIYTFS